ncbi:RebB family R body protein [Zooshikella sp. RANM57]|uniref:RebB family R body protein n=1 Tax=Zooshikella sp. RANM57 TaxID=3425863 RepID=UPI003D6F8D22
MSDKDNCFSKLDENYVNSQISDSVKQLNNFIQENTTSQTARLLDIVSAETLGMAMHNAISAQQNAQMSNTASATATCAKLLGIPLHTSSSSKPTPSKDTCSKFKKSNGFTEQTGSQTTNNDHDRMTGDGNNSQSKLGGENNGGNGKVTHGENEHSTAKKSILDRMKQNK